MTQNPLRGTGSVRAESAAGPMMSRMNAGTNKTPTGSLQATVESLRRGVESFDAEPIPEPHTVEETQLNVSTIIDLVLKSVYFAGQINAHEICSEIRLPFDGVIQRVLEAAQKDQLVEIVGARGLVERGYQYMLTSKGHEFVRDALERNQYVGPAPVSLPVWAEQVKKQSIEGLVVHPEDVQEALSFLVLSPKIVRKVGPAVNSGRSIFLYGPPGNGKTTIAQGIARMLKGLIYIPYAVDVDGHIIRVFDRLNHIAVEPTTFSHAHEQKVDARWVRCKRPVVVVGGELTLHNLDLIYDPVSKFYEAPFQMKASNGLFMIDDFGRQQVRPQDLLNRWIVPLETRIDFLTLHTGKKIDIPFDQLMVFSTNLDPKQLVDEAFLRRIRHKIEITDPTDRDFYEIFQRCATQRNIPFDQPAFIYLMQEWYIKRKRTPKAVHPRDLLDQIIDIANYLNIRPVMSKDFIDQACEAYFVEL